MRALVVVSVAAIVAIAACVPEFVYSGGGETSGSAGGDGEGARDGAGGRGAVGTGGDDRPGVVVGVGPSGGPSVGPGPGPDTTTTAGATTATGAGGEGGKEGDGGADAATTSTTTSATTGGGTEGAPCWDGTDQAIVSCGGGDACCYDMDYYSEHECSPGGTCSSYAYELECNEASDCPDGQRCCMNTDFLDDLESILCDTSCDDYQACSAQAQCPEGYGCYYVFDPDSSHDEYDAYGFCYPD